MEDVRIEDLIPYYPNFDNTIDPVYGKTPEEVIFLKKEFNQCVLEAEEKRSDEGRGTPLKHQIFFQRFFSFDTPYDDIFLYHGVGSGKACTAGFLIELELYRKKYPVQHVIIITPKQTTENFIREIGYVCTEKGRYNRDDIEDEIKQEKQTIKRVKDIYEVVTYQTFATQLVLKKKDKDIDDSLRERWTREYENSIIVMDEAHHLRPTNTNKSDFNILYEFVHTLKNRKLILMSATPIRDDSEEINYILAMINKRIKKFTGIEAADYIEGLWEKAIEDEKHNIKNLPEITKFIRGKVSYMRSMESSVEKKYQGIKIYKKLKHDPVSVVEMSDHQEKAYRTAYLKDTKKEETKDEKHGLYNNSRDALLFVYPDGEIEPPIEYIKPNTTAPTEKFKKLICEGKHLNLENLFKYSCKYSSVIKNIREGVKNRENCLVYADLVKDSGVLLFARLLDLDGFTELETPHQRDKKAKRYIIITGSTESKRATKLINYFNLDKNRYGEYVLVMIITRASAEGKTFKNIRQMHVITPFWNDAVIDQTIGRSDRSFSHDAFSDEKERYVKIFRWLADVKSDDIESVDYRMYNVSQKKDRQHRPRLHILKQYAIDYALNIKRNMREGDIPNSKKCDYKDCKYYSPVFHENIREENNIIDTYSYFFQTEIEEEKYIQEIQDIFSTKFSISIHDIPTHKRLYFLKSADYVIEKKIQIKNPYGFPSFVNESNDIFFCTGKKATNDYMLSLYNKNPFILVDFDITEMASWLFLNNKLNIITSISPNIYKDIIYPWLKNNKKEETKDIVTFAETLKYMYPEIQVKLYNVSLKDKTNSYIRKSIIEYFGPKMTENDGKYELKTNLQFSLSKEDSGEIKCIYKWLGTDTKEDVENYILKKYFGDNPEVKTHYFISGKAQIYSTDITDGQRGYNFMTQSNPLHLIDIIVKENIVIKNTLKYIEQYSNLKTISIENLTIENVRKDTTMKEYIKEHSDKKIPDDVLISAYLIILKTNREQAAGYLADIFKKNNKYETIDSKKITEVVQKHKNGHRVKKKR